MSNGLALRLRLQALAEDHLKDVAGLDVFLALATAASKAGRLEVGVVGPRHFADRRHVGQLQVGDALLQPFDQPVHPLAASS